MRLAPLPQLGYDDLTVLLRSLLTQATQDQEVLAVATAPEIRDTAMASLATTRALLTAVVEARYGTDRPHGGALEPIRVVMEQDDQLAQAWRHP